MSVTAQTIIAQLGGSRFVAMTGAKQFTWSETEHRLTMKLGRNRQRITHMSITLDPTDTYSVEFLRASVRVREIAASHSGIYCNMLAQLVEAETGMALSIGALA